MPDLMTHLTVSYLVKRVWARESNLVAFLVGAMLPDVLSYVPPLLIAGLIRLLTFMGFTTMHEVPDWVRNLGYFFYPFHGPIPLLLLSALVVFCFRADARPGAFLNLWLGGVLHILLDLLQVNHNPLGFLLFPFSWRPCSLGWIETESSLRAVPFLIAICLGVILYDRYQRRNAQPAADANIPERGP